MFLRISSASGCASIILDMGSDVIARLREASDLYSLTKHVLGLCAPYGPVHSFKLVHNRGAERVVCFIELEWPKQQPALVRALGAKVINGSVCLDIPVSEEFGQMSGGSDYKVGSLPMHQLRREVTAPQATS